MIDLKMKVGGYITSIKNMDTGEEFVKEPNHNLVTNSGIDLLLNGRRISNGTTLCNDYFMFTERGDSGLGFAFSLHTGYGTSPTTMTMKTLETEANCFTNILSSGTTTTLVDGKFHQRIVKNVKFEPGNPPITEIAFSPYLGDIFSRVILKTPITTAGTYNITYDFFITLPYDDRTYVSDLGGSGIPGEIKVDSTYYTGDGGVSIPKLAPGYCYSSTNRGGWVGPSSTNLVPVGILVPFCFSTSVQHNPMFSTDTTLDFGDDNTTRLPYYTDGYCTCTPGSYVAGQGYRDFTYTVAASYPASSGVFNIAYINLRGLAMRFGSYVNGRWVGQTLNKDGSYKLNISLRYTYTAE